MSDKSSPTKLFFLLRKFAHFLRLIARNKLFGFLYRVCLLQHHHSFFTITFRTNNLLSSDNNLSCDILFLFYVMYKNIYIYISSSKKNLNALQEVVLFIY